MTADANNNNSRGLPGRPTGETHSVVFGQCIVLFLLHVLYHCIDNLILFNITLTCNVNKSIFRALEREM